uniref:Uncharacterized protein n=1 Tax=Arundo donax TaxID=35708 RepID=A0A0A8YAQ1_ARUDO
MVLLNILFYDHTFLLEMIATALRIIHFTILQ